MYALFLLILAWLAYAFWLRSSQDRLVFRPLRGAVAMADCGLPDFSNVWAATPDGLTLEGWYRPADGLTKPTILILPGSNGHPGMLGDRGRLLADAGYGVLLAFYRGFGGNPGRATEAGLLTDARTWADFLVQKGISGGRLVLYGAEAGCFLAAGLAAERSVAKLVLESPFPDLAALLSPRFPLLPLHGLLRHRFEVMPLLPQIQAPVLILHAGADRAVPVALGRRIDALLPTRPQAFRPDGVAADGLMAAGGDKALLGFLGGETAPPPTLEQKPAGGRALMVRP